MKKQAFITLKNNKEQKKEKVSLELKDEKIYYLEQSGTTVLFNLKEHTLVRENKELYMEFFFGTEKCSIFIKNLKKSLDMNIKTKKIDIANNSIIIEYELEKETYLYKLEMEE